jgi:DNA polymerase V
MKNYNNNGMVVLQPHKIPSQPLPYYLPKVAAGFPSPADDYLEKKLDLNEFLIKRPAATFFIKASGNSMVEKGIFHQDILIVDKSLKPVSGDIVITSIDKQLSINIIHLTPDKKIFLLSGNKETLPLEVTQTSELLIWGVVTYVIHKLKG